MYAKWKLRRIGILSAVKIGSVVSCVIGFVTGAIWALIFMFLSSLMSFMAMNNQVPAFSFAAIIILPVISAVFYTVLGAFLTFFSVLIFNLAAGLLGGLDLEVDYTYIFKEK